MTRCRSLALATLLPVRAGNRAQRGVAGNENPADAVILEAADSVLNLSCRLVGLAVGLQLGIAKHLAGDLLDFAYDPLFRSFNLCLSE